MDACVESTIVGDHSRRAPKIFVNKTSRGAQNNSNVPTLKHSANCACKLLAPVLLCVLFVLANIKSISFVKKRNILSFQELTTDTDVQLWLALADSILLLSVIIVMTIFLTLLYLKRCYKFLNGWLIFATFVMLFILNYFYINTLLSAYNIAMDYPTAIMIIWNFGVAGMLAIHWHAPLRLQQAYLIFVSALMALILIRNLSASTTWFVLVAISFWDLTAVLTAKGPLRLVVKTAQQRNEQTLPALIYSATIVYMFTMVETSNLTAAIGGSACQATESVPRVSLKRHRNGTKVNYTAQTISRIDAQKTEALEIQNVSNFLQTNFSCTEAVLKSSFDIKLGLGDFIFYAVLVGKVSVNGELSTTIACLLVILIGLLLTLLLLVTWRRTLPALPISIFLGLIFYFGSKFFIEPFMANILVKNILI